MMANPLLTPLIPWFNRTPSPPFLVLCFNSACGSFRSTQNLCRVVFDSLHGQLQQVHQAGDITSPKLLTDHFPPSSGAFSLTIPSEHPWPSWDQMPELYRKPLSSILSRKCFHLDVLEGDDSSRSSILVETALLGQVWEAPSTEGPCLHHHHPHYCHPGPGVTCSTWSIFDRQGYLGEALLNGFSYGNPKELWGLDSSSCSPGLQQLFVTLCHPLSPSAFCSVTVAAAQWDLLWSSMVLFGICQIFHLLDRGSSPQRAAGLGPGKQGMKNRRRNNEKLSRFIGDVSELLCAISCHFCAILSCNPFESCLGLAQRGNRTWKRAGIFSWNKSAFPCQPVPLLWGESQESVDADGITSDQLSQVSRILGRCFFKELMETVIPWRIKGKSNSR